MTLTWSIFLIGISILILIATFAYLNYRNCEINFSTKLSHEETAALIVCFMSSFILVFFLFTK